MNLVFRIVRRKSDGRKVVASELAKSAVGGLGSTLALISALISLNSAVAETEFVVGGAHAPTLIGNVTANDATAYVIDINAPVNGISHNTYNKFNVGSLDVILNNISNGETYTTGENTTSTTHAAVQVLNGGLLHYNTHNATTSGQDASSVIINEVVSANTTSLAGKIEVAGSSADVVIANPYGITANGASFINAGEVVLATGSISSAGVGGIKFDLTSAQLTVGDNSSTSTQLTANDLALISRSVLLQGQIKAAEIDVVTVDGNATWNTSTGDISTEVDVDGGTAPSYAIDSTALGGMYADTIKLVANEAGTGVRVLGNMAALGDSINITADGDLVIGETSSNTQVESNTISLTSKTGSVKVYDSAVEAKLNDGNASIGGTLSISADDDLVLDGAALSSQVAIDGSEGTLSVDVNGDITLSDSSVSGDSIDIDAATLTDDSDSSIASVTNLDVLTTGNIALSGSVSTGTGASPIKSSGGDLSLEAGAVLSGKNITLDSNSNLTISNTSDVSTDGALTILGSAISVLSDISTVGALTVGSSSSDVVLGLNATETLLSVGGALSVTSANLDLYADLSVTGASTLANSLTTEIFDQSNITSNGGFTLTGGALTLSGTIYQAGDIVLDMTGDVQITSSGILLTRFANEISVKADGSLVNAGTVSSSDTLTIGDGATGSSLTNTGTLKASGDILINVAGLVYNQAVVDSTDSEGRYLGILRDGAATYEADLSVDETQIGLIESTAGDIDIVSATAINEGEIIAAGGLDLSGTALRNQLAGIWDGTSHTGDTREELMGSRKQYDYVDAGGVESYATDDFLSDGRANFKPSLEASTIQVSSSANNLNIGGSITGTVSSGSFTDVDVSVNRVVTTVNPPVSEPDANGGNVSITADAPIVADGNTDTSIELASNNATWVVNIAEPNSTGLSNNTYSLFNINSNGAIFNNMPFNQDVTAVTDLSAVIVGNPTLINPATVILNQVFSAEASKLNGFMEVAGNSADVLIVNPLGIVCDACGAINVDRFDLVVGSVSLSNGAISSLNTATGSNAGSLVVSGDGLDATAPTWSSVIAPAVTIGGSFNATNLFMGLGSGSFTRGDEAATAYSRATSGASVNSIALTVTEAGGVFADQVELDSQVSSGSSPAIKVFGEIAANAGDVEINSDGLVSVSGRVSASDNLSITTSSALNSRNIAGADIQMLNGAITSGADMVLSASNGSIVFNGGQLYSFADLNLVGRTLVDEATDNPAEFNNTRFAGSELQFNISDDIVLNGTSWEADIFRFNGLGTLDLEIGEGTILKALTLMDMNLRSLQNDGMVASLIETTVDATSSVTNQSNGVMTSAEKSSLTTQLLVNDGTWVGAENDTANGAVTWQVDTIRNNVSGKISAADVWSITDYDAAGNTAIISNTGVITSNLATNANFYHVTNSGDFTVSLRDSGSDSVWTVNTLSNSTAGTLFAGDNWYINSAGLSAQSSRGTELLNQGVIQGYRNLDIAFNTLQLDSSADFSGALKGESGDVFNLAITNDFKLNGLIYSNQKLDAEFTNGLEISEDGALIATSDLELATLTSSNSDLVNYGFIYSGNNATIDVAGDFGNFSTVTFDSTATLLGTSFAALSFGAKLYEGEQTLVSYGDVRADNNLDITVSGDFVNSAEVRAENGALNVTAGLISNQVQRINPFTTDDPIADTKDFNGGMRLNYTSNEGAEVSCYQYPDDCVKQTRTLTWDEFTYFKDGEPAKTPIMMAGTTFNLSTTGNGDINNYGGLIQSTGSGSLNSSGTITNDALVTYKEAFSQTQEKKTTYIALGPLIYEDRSYDWKGDTPSNGVLTTRDVGTKSAAITASNTLSFTGDANVSNFGDVLGGATPPSGSSALDPNGLNINITLPSSPNGFFVTNRDPSAKYLVEMNPKLQSGVSTLGSDYLMESLNINTDTTTRRLGDANYEAYLVEQQLIEATGKGVLDGYANIADVMQGFMNNAVSQAGTLGLSYGQPLTEEQLEALDEPIVWMVEIEVDGQKVLAPKVYLPKKIEEEITQQSAVISANDLDMQVASLDNVGGEISAKNDLNITSEGDINNISGNIKGGNVSVESTEGTINNETFNQYAGNELAGQTVIGKTAGISATNDLKLKAAEDITNLGAEINAGNNAELDAGGDITFDTIEDETRTFEQEGSSGLMSSSYTETQTTTVNQVKSGLNVGGNLSTKSGGDTTFAGTDVNVGGDADIKSDGAINIIARENRVESSSTSESSSVGQNGNLMETNKTTTDSLSIRNVGSTFNVGGNASFDAEENMTIQGSELEVGGDANIKAQSLEVLAGRDLDQTTTTSETTSIGVKAEKMENVDGSESEGVTFGESVKEREERLSIRSQGSKLGIGGNLTVNVEEDVTLQGSEVEAGGDVDIEAENIRLLAAQNVERVTKTTETVKMGLYASSNTDGGAGTDAGTEAGAEAGTDETSTAKTANANAGAGASAGAEASGNASATVDFAVGRKDTELSLDITNTGSLIKSGGNLKLKAEETIELEGSEIVGDGDVDVKATDIIARAAEDISIREKTSESTRVGIYADAEGGAEAGAEAGASAEANGAAGISAQSNEANAEAKAGVNAEAGGKAGVGLQTQVAKLSEKSTTITSQVSAIRSTGGSVTREAENRIVDIGTELEAAQNFTQSAKQIDSLAARNESITERSYSEVTAKAGIYAEAEGEASAEAGASASADTSGAGAEAGAQASAEGGARVGVEVQVDTLDQYERQRNTEAVVSTIKVGGNFSSTSEETSTFEGTNIEAAGDLTVEGEDINILAARNTSESEFSETSTSTRAAVAIGVGGSAEAGAKATSEGEAEAGAEAEGGVKVRAEVSTNVQTNDETSRETEAVTANFSSGGSMNLNAENDIDIEGADLTADEINVDARELNFRAAENTSESTSSSTEVDVEVMVEATIIGSGGVEGEAGVGVGVENESARSSEAVTGSINASNLNITTREDANFEGTQVTATESANLDIAGDLNVTAARNTEQEQSDSTSVEVNVNASSSGEVGADVGVGVSNAKSQSSEAVVATFNVGDLNLKTGGDANFEGTEIQADGDANLDIAGDLNFAAARNTSSSESLDVEVEVGVGASSSEEDDGSSERSGSFEAGASVAVSKAESSEAVTGLLGAGGKLNIKTGGDATFEGTDIAGGEGVDLAAGGNVAFNEAVSTSSSLDVGVGVGVGMEKSSAVDGESGDKTDSSTKSFSAEMELGIEDSAQGKGSSISGGSGGINITSGGNVELTGTEFDSNANIDADGEVIKRELTNESSGFSMDFAVEAEFEDETTTPGGKAAEAEGADSNNAEGADAEKDDTQTDSEADNTRDERDVNDEPLNESQDEPARLSDDTVQRSQSEDMTEAEVQAAIDTAYDAIGERELTPDEQADLDRALAQRKRQEEASATSNESVSDQADATTADDTEPDGEAMRNLFDEDAAAEESGSTSNQENANDSETDKNSEDQQDADADAEEEESEVPEIEMFAEEDGAEEDSGDEDGGDEEGDAPDSSNADESPAAEPQPLTLVGGSVAVPGLDGVASADDIEMVDADGNAVPDWVSVDLETEELKVDTPADFTGSLEINMTLPDGKTFSVSVE